MAGKRRGTPERHAGLPTWAWGVAAVLAVLLFAWFTVPILVGGDPGEPAKSPTDVAPRTPLPSSTSTSSTPSQTSTPTPRPTTPAGLPRLSPDQPRRLSVGTILDVGFTDAVAARGGTLRPASDAEVSRWADRGSPGSPGEDAVVVVGTADQSRPETAFSALTEVEAGTTIRLRTDQGVLTYTVWKVSDVKADELLDSPELTDATAGRLVLVGEKFAPSGDRLNTDRVVVAILTDADPA